MSIEGSINVSALFHDRDGTTAMKVVSLREAQEYTGTQQVVFLTGTANTTGATISAFSNAYRDAKGQAVLLPVVNRLLFRCTPQGTCTFLDENATLSFGGVQTHLFSKNNTIAVTTFSGDWNGSFVVRPISDGGPATCSWTIVMAGDTQ